MQGLYLFIYYLRNSITFLQATKYNNSAFSINEREGGGLSETYGVSFSRIQTRTRPQDSMGGGGRYQQEGRLFLHVKIYVVWCQSTQVGKKKKSVFFFFNLVISSDGVKAQLKRHKNGQYIWLCQISTLILKQTLNLQKKLIIPFTWKRILIWGFQPQCWGGGAGVGQKR